MITFMLFNYLIVIISLVITRYKFKLGFYNFNKKCYFKTIPVV
jgi:hypothetical protein